jgi:hypothetical protein
MPEGKTLYTGLIGCRSAASSRCAISARLDSSSWAARCGSGGAGMRFGSGGGGIWNTGSKGGGTGGAPDKRWTAGLIEPR